LILGPSLAGKTTLSTFLTEGVIPETYVKTAGTKGRKKANGKIELKDVSLKVDVIWDVPGEKEARGEWLAKAKDADLIIYMLSYEEANRTKYVDRVRLDCNQIRDWRKPGGDGVTAREMLVVSHLDCHPDFTGGVSFARAGQAERVARKTAACKIAVRGLGEPPVIAGSLETNRGCADVAYRLLDEAEQRGWDRDE
jgi:hypothetical protein